MARFINKPMKVSEIQIEDYLFVAVNLHASRTRILKSKAALEAWKNEFIKLYSDLAVLATEDADQKYLSVKDALSIGVDV